MKRILIAAVALGTVSGAQAADLAARPYTKASPAVADGLRLDGVLRWRQRRLWLGRKH